VALLPALARLGRGILLGLGLAVAVNVRFLEPRIAAPAGGPARLELRLAGAVTDEVASLVDRSVLVEIGVSFDFYLEDGRRLTARSLRTLSYRSLDRRYVVEGGAEPLAVATLAEAIELAETHGAELPRERFKTCVVKGSLALPSLSGTVDAHELWGGQTPTLIYDARRP